MIALLVAGLRKTRGLLGSLRPLGHLGDALGERREAEEDPVSLVGFGLSERRIRSVQIIQHSQHSVALIEPGNQTEIKHRWKLPTLPHPSYCRLSEPR